MRTLKFIVTGQVIKPHPDCDLEGLVPGTDGYLKAEFSFSREWDGYVKVAAFYNALGIEYSPQPLTDGASCIIPAEALEKRVFKIKIIGKKDQSKLTTNKVAVIQSGGKT